MEGNGCGVEHPLGASDVTITYAIDPFLGALRRCRQRIPVKILQGILEIHTVSLSFLNENPIDVAMKPSR